MTIYHAFLSFDDRDGVLPETLEILAESREDARDIAAKKLREYGMNTAKFDTSEEVVATKKDGKEYVYYGFDED